MRHVVLAFIAIVVSLAALSAQTAIPTREGRGGQPGQGGGQGRRGGGPGPEINLPAAPVAVPLPTLSAEITGPGPIFESLMQLKPGDDMAHFKYDAHEYFVSGTANGQPYTTRIVDRRMRRSSAGSCLRSPCTPVAMRGCFTSRTPTR